MKCHCFSGISSSAVPVICKGKVIGTLRSGQIFYKVPNPKIFGNVAKTLRREELARATQS